MDSSTQIASIITSLTTWMSDMSGSIMDMLGTMVPIVLGVVGAVTVIRIGLKLFKQLVRSA